MHSSQNRDGMGRVTPPPPCSPDDPQLGSYLSITYRDLFKAHVLDVHLPNLLIGIGASIETPLVTILGRRIGASYAAIADFISITALCRTILDIPISILVEYVGVRNVMFACLLLNIVASVVGFKVDNATTLVIFCVLSGVSLGGFFLARHIFVAGISSKKYRGLLMSILAGLLRWSHVLGPVASGLFATYWGDVRYSFLVSAIASAAAFTTLSIATWSAACQTACAQSCTVSVPSSGMATPLPVEADGDGEAHAWEGREDTMVTTPFVPDHGHANGVLTAAEHNIIGAERSATVLPLLQVYQLRHAHHRCIDVPSRSRCSGASTSLVSLHPSMDASQRHYIGVGTLWGTMLDYWGVIWRLGIYVVFATALRANRKLLLSFAGMRAAMTDAQVSYLIGFSFIFDALLFPLGGVVMDLLGRQYAMMPFTAGLALVFLFLPFCTTEGLLYLAAAAFGIVDALGCGLIMTLTADRAPPLYGAPFFGIMQTVQDLGHVVGARGASSLMRYSNFSVCCWTLTACGLFTAAWGVLAVPSDRDGLPETPRLRRAATTSKMPLHSTASSSSLDAEQTMLLPRSATVVPSTPHYGT